MTVQQINKDAKKSEWAVTIITFVLLVLAIATYILDQKKSNWVCGPVLLIFELIALGLQSILTFVIWKTKSKKIKVAITVSAFGVLGFIIYGFVNFLTNCS